MCRPSRSPKSQAGLKPKMLGPLGIARLPFAAFCTCRWRIEVAE
jgi:hypothetical protein